MADFSALISQLQADIKTNLNQEITGAILQQDLLAMVNAINQLKQDTLAGYAFYGAALSNGANVSVTQNTFFLAGAGTYTINGTSITISDEGISLIVYDSVNNTLTNGGLFTFDTAPVNGSAKAVTSGGVYTALDGKADKVAGATSGHLASLDADGNLADSGVASGDVMQAVGAAVEDNIAVFDADGKVKDGGKAIADLADKDTDAVEGNLAEFDASGNPVDSGVATDDVALQDGSYPNMSVGTASNLAGRGSVPAEYTFRTSGGSADLGSGSALIKKMKGKSIVWNQLVDSGTTSVTIPSGRKYVSYINGTWAYGTSDGTPMAVTGGTDMVIDLTLMFGAGNEPSSVAEFKALYSLLSYDYNAGVIKNNGATGIKTTGFNQWDEEWEEGALNPNTGGMQGSAVQIRSKNFVPVIAGASYYFPNKVYVLWCYDANKNPLSRLSWGGTPADITIPQNAAFIKFDTLTSYGTTYNNDICINLSWSGYRNGEYEAYWESLLSLNLKTITGIRAGGSVSEVIFPDGMRGAGTDYDELVVDADGWARKAIKRVGSVDLGTLDWAYDSTYTRMVSSYITDMRGYQQARYGIVINGRYVCISDLRPIAAVPNKSCYLGAYNPGEGQVYVKDSDYTDAATFKAAMDGVGLNYELATPVEYTLDNPIYMGYRVDDFGTEQRLPADTANAVQAPIAYDVQYAMNAVDTLRRLPENYISKESLVNLLTALQTAGVISAYTMVYNSTTQEYDFTITQ